jgi:hypothetical protein
MYVVVCNLIRRISILSSSSELHMEHVIDGYAFDPKNVVC